MLDVIDVVVVDSEEIDRFHRLGQITLIYQVGYPVVLERGRQALGISPLEHSTGEQPVLDQVDGIRRRPVLSGVGPGPGRDEVENDPETVLVPNRGLTHDPDRPVVGQQQMMGHQQGYRGIGVTRGVLPGAVTERAAPGLVERRPSANHVTQRVLRHVGVFGEPGNRLGVGPPSMTRRCQSISTDISSRS